MNENKVMNKSMFREVLNPRSSYHEAETHFYLRVHEHKLTWKLTENRLYVSFTDWFGTVNGIMFDS